MCYEERIFWLITTRVAFILKSKENTILHHCVGIIPVQHTMLWVQTTACLFIIPSVRLRSKWTINAE